VESSRDLRVTTSLSGLDLFIGLALVTGVNNTRANAAVRQLEQEVINRTRHAFSLETLKDDPVVRCYRAFYWQTVKVDPTKVRPAAEALIRRVLQGKGIPSVSVVVDAYNMGSVATRISFGGYDGDALHLPLRLRRAGEDDLFNGIGMAQPVRLRREMLILADQRQPICVYPYRDADATKITERTRNVLLVAAGVPGLRETDIEGALATTTNYVTRVAGGVVSALTVQYLGHPGGQEEAEAAREPPVAGGSGTGQRPF